MMGSTPRTRWSLHLWRTLCLLMLVIAVAKARFTLDELPEEDMELEDPLLPAPSPTNQKGGKGSPSKAPAPTPAKSPASEKPAVAPEKPTAVKGGSSSSKASVVKEPPVVVSSPSSSSVISSSPLKPSRATTKTRVISAPKLSMGWARSPGLQKAVVPSLLTVTVGALASTVWKRHGLSIRGLLGRARTATGSSAALTSYVLELESRLMNLQNESEELAIQLTRVQASKTEELMNARSMVDQQKKELEALKANKMDLEQEIESLKGSFQARLEVVRLEAANHVEDADKVRSKIEAEYRAKYTSALSKEQELIRAEVEKELKQSFDEQLKTKMAQCEKELIALYKQRIDESTAKLKESYERKLQNQEEEFRGQLEALRSKFQSLYREGIETQKEKMLERVKKEYRRRPPQAAAEGDRGQYSQRDSSSPQEHHHRQQYPHRGEPSTPGEGYNRSQAMPARLGL